MNKRIQMSQAELFKLAVSVDLETAGRAFGIGRTKAFELARAGQFPVPVLRVGVKYRVTRTSILKALGIDPAAAVSQDPRLPPYSASTRAPEAIVRDLIAPQDGAVPSTSLNPGFS